MGEAGTGVSRTSKEAVELHEKLKVDIVAFRSLAVAVLNVVPVQVDTWR